MSDKTKIEWCDATWNPIAGCTRVSEGCRNCYAERLAHRFAGPGQHYEGLTVLRNGALGWSGNVTFYEPRLREPLKWRKPRRIFVNSMSDLFHEAVTDEMRDRIFAVMALCPQHTFQVLTKRPERMRDYFDDLEGREQAIGVAAGKMLDGNWIWNEGKQFRKAIEHLIATSLGLEDDGERQAEERLLPLPNVWLGVSVEDQKTADARIPLLLQTPAALRFVSCEPLLGPVDLERITESDDGTRWWRTCLESGDIWRSEHGEVSDGPEFPTRVDWVICGGESGPGARPMHLDWVRSLREQANGAAVPFFFKQWGDWLPAMCDGTPGEGQILNASDEAVRVGKKAAGALLDGVEWKQFPEVGR